MKDKIVGFLTATMICIILFLIFCLDSVISNYEKTKNKNAKMKKILNCFCRIDNTSLQ